MSVQFPTLSQADQQQRYTDMAKMTLYPYSYVFRAVSNTATFNKTSIAALNTNYFTIEFKADNNLAVSIFEFNASLLYEPQSGSGIESQVLFEVSYLNTLDPTILNLNGAPPATPTIPTDNGNIIYRNIQKVEIPQAGTGIIPVLFNFGAFHRYTPYNYLLKYNQSLFMHVGLGAGLTDHDGAGVLDGSFIFHTLPTGLQI